VRRDDADGKAAKGADDLEVIFVGLMSAFDVPGFFVVS
jgi:hypothetical protein